MIKLTKLDLQVFILNGEIIETVEEVPHTVIKTMNGNKYIVKESADEVVEKVVEYKRMILSRDDLKGI